MEEKYINVPVDISVGDIFKSYEEFDKKLKLKSEEKYVQYFRRDSRSVNAAKTKTKRYLNPNLKYYQLKYACIHGGREHTPHGKGIRNKKTFRNEELCPANITLRISSSGNELVVIQINTRHNHKIDKNLFRELPHQRKLPPEIQNDAKKLLKLKGNKHLIREEIERQSKKVITLKDLTNLRQQDRKNYSNNIETACKIVNTKFDADCHLLVDTNNTFKGLLFCTPAMKVAMNAYPEMICIDATYKLLNIRAPVYVILIEDGNGESIVVAVGILTSEDHDSLQWLLQKFIEINPSCQHTKNVMADKDWVERDVLHQCFPQAQLLICIFHVFKIFQREITMEKMKITNSERVLALQLLQEMTYCSSQTEFDKIKLKIETNLSQSIVNYLEEHWFSINDEWCPRLGNKVLNFLNTTNNRLEGLNAKLKSVISKNSTLEEFLEQLFICLKSLEKERKTRLANILNKRTVSSFKIGRPEHQYSKYVTEYALNYILKQLKYFDIVKYTTINNIDFSVMSCRNNGDCYATTMNSCSCYFFTSMQLPCKHIFAIRNFLQKDLFDINLVNKRWTLQYLLENQSFFTTCTSDKVLQEIQHEDHASETTVNIASATTSKPLSQQEKYKQAFLKCKVIACLAAEATGKNFDSVLNALNAFVHLLENNQHNITVTSANYSTASENHLIHTDNALDNIISNRNSETSTMSITDSLFTNETIMTNGCDDLISQGNQTDEPLECNENQNAVINDTFTHDDCDEFVPNLINMGCVQNNVNTMTISSSLPKEVIVNKSTSTENNSNNLFRNVRIETNGCDELITQGHQPIEYNENRNAPIINDSHQCDDFVPNLVNPGIVQNDLNTVTIPNINCQEEVIVTDKKANTGNDFVPNLVNPGIVQNDLNTVTIPNINCQEEVIVTDKKANTGNDFVPNLINPGIVQNDLNTVMIPNINCQEEVIVTDKKANTGNDFIPNLINPGIVQNDLNTVMIPNINCQEEVIVTDKKANTDLTQIKVPPVLKKRGRPAGSDLTAIGLQKKKKIKNCTVFEHLNKQDKINILLEWVVSNPKGIYTKVAFDITDLKSIQNIDIRLVETNITVIKKYFTTEAWTLLQSYKKQIKCKGKWLCPFCKEFISDLPCIRCDKCLNWVHIACLTRGSIFNKKTWFCSTCLQ